MKILLAPDSFKGTLTAKEIIRIISEEIQKAFPDCIISGIPMADGGEGTMDTIRDICNGEFCPVTVHGPLMELRDSGYTVLENGTALIEMAAASAITMVPDDKRNPELTTTYGTGELIKDALLKGHRKFIIGVGGSATNDGGIGALSALGVRFLGKYGNTLEPIGRNLINICSIDTSELLPSAADSEFTIMCDVDNPLIGPRGAAYIFSPQKGADKEMQDRLEAGMTNYAERIKELLGIDLSYVPGAGAAGGLSAGLMAFLKGRLSSGIETVLKLSHFSERIKDVDLVITGEGRADSQSAHGKVLWGVGRICAENKTRAIAVAGCTGDGFEELYNCGIKKVIPIVSEKISSEYSMSHPEDALRQMIQSRLISEMLQE